MSPVAETLFQQVSILPEEERAEKNPEYKEWWAEIERRLQSVEDGTEGKVDAKELVESLRQKSLITSRS